MENQELISTLVHALELALPAGEIVLVGSHESEGLTEENKEWLASLIYDDEDEEEEEDDEEEEETDEFDKALAVAEEMLKSPEFREILKVFLSH